MSWLRCFLAAAGLGAGVLSLGSLALLAHDNITQGGEPILFGFSVFVLAGGLTVALLALAWRAGHSGEPDWRHALFLLLALLFAVFIWPTPYEHYRAPESVAVVRVNRVTGAVTLVPPQRSRR